MKKRSLVLAALFSTNLYANTGDLTAQIAFQGDYSGVTLDYVTSAPNHIENTKNGYYEGKLVYLSGSAGDLNFSHTLIGASYGISDKINDQFDFFAQLGLGFVSNSADISISGSRYSESSSGVELLGKVGVMSSLNEKIDYRAFLAIEDGTVLGVNATYKHSDKLTFVAGIETFNDSRLSFGAKFQF